MSSNPRLLNALAGGLFLVDAAYTYFKTPNDLAGAVIWAAVGVIFLALGLARPRAQ